MEILSPAALALLERMTEREAELRAQIEAAAVRLFYGEPVMLRFREVDGDLIAEPIKYEDAVWPPIEPSPW